MKTIEGWLIKYGKPSSPLTLGNGKTVVEMIAPGAFADSVDQINAGKHSIEANIEHVDDAISRIGLSGKNIKVENRSEGVYATINLPDETLSNDVFAKAKLGIISGLSIEFGTIKGFDPVYSNDGGNYIRTINKASLNGFAICAKPAYPDAQITAATGNGEQPITIRN